MEEIEVPTEHLHEEMAEHAQHSKSRWTMGVALSSALLAGLAAVCSLLAGHHSNEAMLEQMKSSDQWAYYQAKGIKAAILSSKIELLQGEGRTVSPKDQDKLEQYKKDQDEATNAAKEHEADSQKHLASHVVFARGVTLFQIAIAIGAISVLIHRKSFWLVSLAFGGVGVFFLIQGFLR